MKVAVVDSFGMPLSQGPHCFLKGSNGSLNFDYLKPLCWKFPGIAVEILLLSLNSAGIDHKFILADGYSDTTSGRGMMQLVEDGQADAGENLIRTPTLSIVKKMLMQGFMPLGIIATFFMLFTFRLTYRMAQVIPVKTKLILAEATNVVLSKPDKSLPGKLHSRFASTLIAYLVLRGSFKAGLVSSFCPTAKFPFHSLSELTNSVASEEWRLSAYSKSSAPYVEISQYPHLKALHDAIKMIGEDRVRDFQGNIHSLNTALKKSDKMMLRIWPNRQNVLSRSMICMCHSLGLGITSHISFPIAKGKQHLLETINRKLLRITETGMLNQLRKKYSMKTRGDSNPDLLLWAEKKSVKFSGPLHVDLLKVPCFLFSSFIALSLVVFLTESLLTGIR